MTLKDYKLLIASFLLVFTLQAQHKVSGYITHSDTNSIVENVEVYDKVSGLLTSSDSNGYYEFVTSKNKMSLAFYIAEFRIFEQELVIEDDVSFNVVLTPLKEELSEIVISARKTKVFELKRLKEVEETAIYAGKKTEVILVEQSMANLASNNARQIYSQVAGLNIFQNDDAGLQLNIGGRGLDPNRTSNFNTRQNGYDISADVLGYPESYYTPASEGLEEIQVIRGAASLQYGTQFGGLINFKMKTPNANKPIELITRNTLGSYGLYTNFSSLSGTIGKFSYYTYFNYKKGDGFRPNSQFESKNVYAHVGYQFNERTKISADITHLYYLAQQAGGLTDAQFEDDIFQSNRKRNWFKVNWLLYNIKLSHKFSDKTNFTFNVFGLNAERNALGYRGNFRLPEPNPVLDDDEFFNNQYDFRDLILGEYNNFGFETRLLSNYNLFNQESTFLIGAKYYNASNVESQGAGSRGINPDFNFVETGDYINSDFDLPNENIAVFGENILRLSDKFSITPGFRFEYIKTQSKGEYTRINRDAAGNPIASITEFDNRVNERNFILFGIGASYKPNTSFELYGNVSQNYRSVTFSDIRTVNPSFLVDENISDEKGQTLDLGVRGKWSKFVNYDISAFGLFYNDRIGVILESEGPDKGNRLRTNIGDALIFGFESLVEWNVLSTFNIDNSNYRFTIFNNLSLIASEYTSTISRFGVEGNEVEFVPNVNLKSGLKFGYKNVLASVQYSYLSDQFSDASNAIEPNESGTRGKIPAYSILDLSLSYTYKMFKLETGINNVLDETYFTRRATGYPGPGIIPSAPRNWFTTLQITF